MFRNAPRLFAALFLCLPLAGEAQAMSASGAAACSARFHASLAPIAETWLPRMKEARALIGEGDARLPERPIFRLSAPPHARDERAAYSAATRLILARGRATWTADRDDRWIVDRIRADLTDFLTQAPAPYLCGGIDAYLGGLRAYVKRVATGGSRSFADLAAIQAKAASRSVEEALTAMRPVPLPRWAPRRSGEEAPGDSEDGATPMSGLRPGLGIAETRRTDPIVTRALTPIAYGPGIDPDLPPKRADSIALDSDADRIAAIDRLVAAAERFGLADQIGASASSAMGFRPVLARLEAVAPLLSRRNEARRDPLVVPALRQAFAQIEALDALAHARDGGPDPLLSAIGETLDAIEAARGAAAAPVIGAR